MRRRPTLRGLVLPMVFAVLLLAPGRTWAGLARPGRGSIPVERGAPRRDGGGEGATAPSP